MSEQSGAQRVAWQQQRENLFNALDSLAYEIISNSEKPENAEFWKSDLDLSAITSNFYFSWDTFRNKSGYAKMNNYHGIKDAGRKSIDFNPYKYLRGRNLSPDHKYYIEEVGETVDR